MSVTNFAFLKMEIILWENYFLLKNDFNNLITYKNIILS